MKYPDASPALFTDLYELTMAQAYWQSRTTGTATFSLFFRKYPRNRGYLVCAGLTAVLDYLEAFRFSAADLDYLHSLQLFQGNFLDFLAGLRFTGDVRAVPEGSLFFVHEPVVEVTAPIIEAQLVETFIVNQVHLQTILASKAARVRHAARDKQVVDFAARRTHGVDTANQLARAGYLVGYDGTSNTLAGALYDIPVYGTMAHSFVTAYPSEIESFRQYARSFPDTSTFLVDTYDTLEGTRKAVVVAGEMMQRGHRLRAIRLDSGDLGELAVQTRALMDAAGFSDVKIFASGGLDEFEVDRLLTAGAPIDGFGVGTRAGVSADAAYGDCAYKLVQYEGRPVFKLSPGKQTWPAPKQVIRSRDGSGRYLGDVVARRDQSEAGEPLLREVMRGGRRLEPQPSLGESRRLFLKEFACLPEEFKVLENPAAYPVRISDGLKSLQEKLVREIHERELPLAGILSTGSGHD